MPERDYIQTYFNDDGKLIYYPQSEWQIDNHLFELFRCPFCLYETRLYRFILRKRDGKYSRMCKCLECNVKFHLLSLVTDMTLSQYAKWIVDYPYAEFWRRCKFDVWVERLYKIDAHKQFWESYHSEKSKVITLPR